MRAVDAIRLWLLVPFALTLVAPATHGACTGNITDLRVTDPPAQSYAHVEADYALTEASGGITISRRDEVTGDETFGFPANANVSGSGTFSSDIGFECIIPNRAYSYRAVLTTGCNPQITAERTLSRTYDPRPTADGAIVSMAEDKLQMTMSVHYAFPYVREDGSPGRRRIQYQIDGTHWGEILLQPGEPREGTKTRVASLSCLGSGPHRLTFSATFNPQSNSIVCWSSPEDEPEVFDIKQAAITSLDIQPVGDGRHFLATAGYRFESTPTDSRRLILSFNNMQDVQGAACCSPAGTATKEFELQNCLAPGTYTLTAKAVSCNKPDDPRFTDVKTMSLTIPMKKGDVSLERLLDPLTSAIKLKAGHTLPPGITSATRTVRALKIVGDDGIPLPDIEIQTKNVTPSTPASEELDPWQPPKGARSIKFVATLTFCNGQAVAAAGWECEKSCSGQPQTGTGKPISFEDGNAGYSDHDPLPTLLDGVALARTYDSHHRVLGSFGRGWVSMFDTRLFILADPNGDTISMTDEKNESFIFLRRGGVYSQLWPRGRTSAGSLSYESASDLYLHRPAGATTVRLYRAGDGRFAGYRQLGTGREMRIEYDTNGLPTTVRDSWTDVTWTVTVNAATKRITSIAATGLTWQYQYVDDNLSAVLAPASAPWRTYEYANDLMTAARDPRGNLIEGHTYDADGRAIGETGPDDEIDSLQYNAPGTASTQLVTRVTMKSGATAEYTLQPIAGSWRTVRISNGCSSCGAREGVYAYDAEGHWTREQNASGYVTLRMYAGDRIVTMQQHLRPAGCDPETSPTRCMLTPDALKTSTFETTAATITTSYEYGDPAWPDRATAILTGSVGPIEEPKREEMIYHPLTGELVSHSIAGWPTERAAVTVTRFYGDASTGGDDPDPADPFAPAFHPGGTFQQAWMSLPQPRLRKSVDGPRTDVADMSEFVYYPVDTSVTPAALRGRLAAARNAAGHITRFESYDAFGNPTRIVDANGVATEMTYDALGRMLTSTIKGVSGCDTTKDSLCATDLTTTRSYVPASGPLQSEQRPGGGITVYEYDENGRVRNVSRGPSASDLRERIETTYDSLTGRKGTERRLAWENGAWVEKTQESHTYDSLAQLQRITHADNTFVHYTYDAAGRVATVRDENHSAANTTYAYDPAGRIAIVQQSLAGATGGVITTRYGYDVQGNLTSVTDPNGNVTSYVYDDLGRMLSQQSPVTGTTVYAYDDAGNLIESQDANEAVTQRTYDPLNRVTSSISTQGEGTETVTWSYDDATSNRFAVGRLSAMTDPSGSTGYRYERRGLLQSETRVIGGWSSSTEYAYDVDGNRTKLGALEYAYDYAGRPLTVARRACGTCTAVPLVTSASYLPFGPEETLVFGNGTRQSKSYDQRYRMTGNSLRNAAGAVLADFFYAADGVGNITEIADAVDATFSRTFAYDDLHRLTNANTGSSLWETATYQYDAMGNIESQSVGGWSVSYGYDGTTPRISTVTEQETESPVESDAAGNETAARSVARVRPGMDFAGGDQNVAREYSPRNLLARVTTSGVACFFPCIPSPFSPPRVFAYAYDGRGLRAHMEASSGQTQDFVYTPELNLSQIREASGNTTTDLVWFGGHPVAAIVPSAPSIYYTFTDHLGTPVLQTDQSGSIAWFGDYEPYGRLYSLRTDHGYGQPLRLPGQDAAVHDENGDEHYNIFRWYRAGWGRYTQSDPIGLAGGTNLFAYVDGNPVNYTDPVGLIKPVPPSKQKWRPCKNAEIQKCQATCKYGMESCMVSQTWKIIKMIGGKTLYGWVDGPMSCSCKEPSCYEKFKKWLNDVSPDHPLPFIPFLPPFEVTPAEPVTPGFVPIINPCLLKASLCDPGGPA